MEKDLVDTSGVFFEWATLNHNACECSHSDTNIRKWRLWGKGGG